ncbi:MAG: ATP-binding cassette domain-containing protein [bacterium]|nr:ATP-binding cassette domain-containing protein [bacterium]
MSSDMNPDIAFEARGVSRRFGATQALDNVDFDLRAGEIHALVGENGAGKTTLAKIVAGALRPDSGTLRLFGEPYDPRRRSDGSASGVAHVRQQLSLVRGLTVAQNIELGRPRRQVAGAPEETAAPGDGEDASLPAAGRGAGRRPWPRTFNAKAARAEVERLAAELDLSVPPDELVDGLPLAVRQQAEILISLAWGARLLILDEPSSALGPLETEALIELCLRLRSEGTPIIYISHRLPELAELADRLTVLRQGRVVTAGEEVAGSDLRRIAELMVGDLSLLEVRRPDLERGDVRLEADGLHLAAEHGPGLRDVSLRVRAGEIVGVVGVAGNGQEELASVLTGQATPDGGTVRIDGTDVTGSPGAAVATGMALLPEDRTAGLAAGFTLADNLIARRVSDAEFARFGVRLRASVRRHARALAQRFDVRPPEPALRAASLSGGNQQKLMAAREMERDPAVLVAAGPTKGLDPHAGRAIRDRCFEAAARGGAVVIISADLDEVADLSHRVVVLSGGRVTDRFGVEEMTSARLGAVMAGLHWDRSGERAPEEATGGGGDGSSADSGTPQDDGEGTTGRHPGEAATGGGKEGTS